MKIIRSRYRNIWIVTLTFFLRSIKNRKYFTFYRMKKEEFILHNQSLFIILIGIQKKQLL